jgi:plastocyanin
VAEGGALGARLAAAPALNRPDLQGFEDIKATLAEDIDDLQTTFGFIGKVAFQKDDLLLIEEERMTVVSATEDELTVKRAAGHTQATPHAAEADILRRSKQALDVNLKESKVNLITNTITCGRVGTAMPAWGARQGGVLSDEQIRQLMTLIVDARWDLVKEEVDLEDRMETRLLEPVTAETVFFRFSDLTVFNDEDAIRMGDERLRIKELPTLARDAKGNVIGSKSGLVRVERGILNSPALEHDTEEAVFRFPETAEPSINQASCGQTAQPAAPPGVPELIEPFTGQTVDVTALGIKFNRNEISVKTGGQVRVRLNNQDQDVEHNIAFYKSSTDLTPVATGSVGTRFVGPGVDDTAFDVPAVGEYFFRCDVHPQTMTGDFIVTP